MRARLCWVEVGQVLVVEGELPDEVVRDGAVVLDEVSSPGPAGIFQRLSDGDAWLVAPQDPVPVFLHSDYDANVVEWRQPLADLSGEAAAAESARKAVFELVEARVADGTAYSASAVVTATEGSAGDLVVVGRCLVVRKL
jgi:hypothetical protein